MDEDRKEWFPERVAYRRRYEPADDAKLGTPLLPSFSPKLFLGLVGLWAAVFLMVIVPARVMYEHKIASLPHVAGVMRDVHVEQRSTRSRAKTVAVAVGRVEYDRSINEVMTHCIVGDWLVGDASTTFTQPSDYRVDLAIRDDSCGDFVILPIWSLSTLAYLLIFLSGVAASAVLVWVMTWPVKPYLSSIATSPPA